MRGLLLAALALTAISASACGAGAPDRVGVSTSRSDEALPETVRTPDPSGLYEADAMVLEADEGPMLCLGGVLLSLPPQCGDLPIANWDWDSVEGEESRAGVTWGNFHVVGRLDGEAFTVTEVGPYDPGGQEFGSNPDFKAPCPEPDGGWVVPDPAHNTQEETRRAHAYARAQPDYVISWNDHLDDELQEFSPVVLVAVFTGDADRHEAEIRRVWDGPLCVVRREGHTAKELAAIRREAERWLQEELGLRMIWSQEGPLGQGAAEVGVIVDPGGAAQAALDERYGPGMVRLFPALRPVEEF
jgi:hypothetical protein